MQGSGELINQIYSQRKSFSSDVRFSALVPNEKGIGVALETPIEEIAIFGACIEGFSKHNINCTASMKVSIAFVQSPNLQKGRSIACVATSAPHSDVLTMARSNRRSWRSSRRTCWRSACMRFRSVTRSVSRRPKQVKTVASDFSSESAPLKKIRYAFS